MQAESFRIIAEDFIEVREAPLTAGEKKDVCRDASWQAEFGGNSATGTPDGKNL